MKGWRGGAAAPAALLISWLAAGCAATEGAAPEDAAAKNGGAGAYGPRTAASEGSILGLPAEALRVEVEAGTGLMTIVRKPVEPGPFAEEATQAAAEGTGTAATAPSAEDAAEAAAAKAAAANRAKASARERRARDRETQRETAVARRDLGLALERIGDIPGAVSELEAALKAAPWSGPAADTPWSDLARICRRGEPAEAVARACARAITSARYGPAEMAEFFALRGDANARLGRTQRALKDYDTALEIDSSHYGALLGRARLRVREGQPAMALNDLRLAIATGPRPAEARLERARAYAALGRFARAVADYDAVLAEVAAEPWEPAAWRGRAVAHCAMGRAPAAAVDWKLWANSVPEGPVYLQEMLRARDYLRGPWENGIGPATLAALRAWTAAGCP